MQLFKIENKIDVESVKHILDIKEKETAIHILQIIKEGDYDGFESNVLAQKIAKRYNINLRTIQ